MTKNSRRSRQGTAGALCAGLCLLGLFIALPTEAQVRSDYDSALVWLQTEILRTMATSTIYDVEVTLRNTGVASWSQADSIKLGAYDGASQTFGPVLRVQMPPGITITNGQSHTFHFQVTAPATAGDYSFAWRMLKETPVPSQNFWFGAVLDEPVEVADMSQAITISGEEFFEGDPAQGARRFAPVGATILPIHSAPLPQCANPPDPNSVRGPDQLFWCNYFNGVDEVEDTMRVLASQGANAVRVPGIGQLLETSENIFDLAYCDLFGDLKASAAHYGMRLVVSLASLTRHQSLYNVEFCAVGDPICQGFNSFPTDYKGVVLDAAARQFSIDRMTNFIDQCGLKDDPEIFSYRIIDEPITGAYVNRSRDFVVSLWNQHLIDEFGSLDNALVSWGFDPAGQVIPPRTCGASGTELCPPTDNVFCVERAGGWGQFAREHRRFFDQAFGAAYTDMANQVRTAAGSTLLATAFPTWLHQNDPSALCQAGGQWLDPSWSAAALDYTSVNANQWAENDATFPMLQLFLDYARGAKPIVVQEFGFTSCVESSPNPDLNLAGHGICAAPGDQATADAVQLQRYQEAVAAFEDRQIHGGLSFTYRNHWTSERFGAVRLDGTTRPVFWQLAFLFRDLRAARDTVTESPTQLTIDPYASVLLENSLLQHLSAHQTAASGGVVRISTP